MRQTTIKDIAEKLRLSPSTVSRALNDHPDISENTKDRVRSLAERLEYQPNSIAQSLQKRRSKIIGVVVPQVKHVFFASIMGGITDVAYDAGYTVMICSSNESHQREEMNIRELIAQRVAGLLISITQSTEGCEHFKWIRKRNIPLVFFDRVCEELEASQVVVDDHDGAFKAVQHLVQRGYKRIAHIGGPEFLNISRERLRGYRDALHAAGREIDETLILHAGLNEEHGIQGMTELLDAVSPGPDAVFCVNDPVAIGAYSVLRQKGLKIPADVALAGFSDNPIASIIDPPLTTVLQPATEMGRRAAQLLLRQIEFEKETVPVREVLKTELVVRQST
ncbi:MAG TPA: LacI family transcriptional regulator [bacterium]|nr:LacI family transcriptional regulator [bacterium]